MAEGCSWDLLVFGKNLDASVGDVALAVAAGEELYTADGAAGTGTKVQPKEDGHITAFGGVSEDGGLVSYQIGLSGEADKIGGKLFHSGQGEGGPFERLIGRCMKKITRNDTVIVNITNAAAKMDSVGLLIGKGTKPKLSVEGPKEIPEGAYWVEATTSFITDVDGWKSGDISFPDFTLKAEKNYKILAAVHFGASLQWWRYKAKSGPDVGNRPGSRGGTSDQINIPVYFSNPPQFVGKDGVQLDTLCTIGDASTTGMMLLQEI